MRRHDKATAIGLIILGILLVLFISVLIYIYVTSPPPVSPHPPDVEPTLIGDSGTHQAMNADNVPYTIALRYDAMDQDQKAAANRFGRAWPSGQP